MHQPSEISDKTFDAGVVLSCRRTSVCPYSGHYLPGLGGALALIADRHESLGGKFVNILVANR